MSLKLLIAATLFVAVPIVAFPQSDKPNAQPSKPTIEDAQKLVETISGDKDKLKVYCEIAKLHERSIKRRRKATRRSSKPLPTNSMTSNSKWGRIT